jgi:hypothetical protein
MHTKIDAYLKLGKFPSAIMLSQMVIIEVMKSWRGLYESNGNRLETRFCINLGLGICGKPYFTMILRMIIKYTSQIHVPVLPILRN